MADQSKPDVIPLDPSEIPEEAKKKKEVLDKVESSERPVKAVLEELGISRSTYYHWRKRYDEEGMAGLMDLRAAPREEKEEPEEEPEAAPEAEEVWEPEAAEVKAKFEEEVGPQPEREAPKPKPPGPPAGGGGRMEEKKGLGAYYLIAGLLIVVGLLIAVSLANSSRHFFKVEEGKIVMYKGKFAPSGTLLVEEFQPIDAKDLDLKPILGEVFYGRITAERALHGHFVNLAVKEYEKDDLADLKKANQLLAMANELADNGVLRDSNAKKNAKVLVTIKKVDWAERLLKKTYQEAEPVLYDAFISGNNFNEAEIKQKLERIRAYLEPMEKEVKEAVKPGEPAKAEEAEKAEVEALPEATEPEAPAVEPAPKAVPAAPTPKAQPAAKPEAPEKAEAKIEAAPEGGAKKAPAPEKKAEEEDVEPPVS